MGQIERRSTWRCQGGGAYGAFTWGVLDHVLKEEGIEIEGITGASSSAVNAIMLADGLARGGPEEARRRLADFWRATSLSGNLPDAQRPKMPVVGFLGSDTAELYADRLRAFRQGLGESGYVDGRNVAIEYRWAEGHTERLHELASELVRRKVDVIVSHKTPGPLAAKQATSMIPIVFRDSGRTLSGTASSPASTGRAVTSRAWSFSTAVLGAKRLVLLHQPQEPVGSPGMAGKVKE